jgi:uncharacterized protein YkwD
MPVWCSGETGRSAKRSAARVSARKGLSVMSVALLATVAAETARAVPGPPTNEEYALLVFANEARSNPAVSGGTEPAVPPMVWSDGLGAAARFHSDDMAENGCFQHNSCGGGSWINRVESYYPSWEWLGENIGSGTDDPAGLNSSWLSSPGHRANILSGAYNEFGGGIAIGQDGFGPFPVATEDMGEHALIALELLPTLPAGTVLPRIGGTEARQLVVNYYHYHGAPPSAVRARVGSSCVNLALRTGTATHGTYAASRSISGSGCIPLVFEAVRSDGLVARFPASGSILVGVGSSGANCAETTTASPSASCGSGPLPTPTPTPGAGPTPAATPTPVVAPAAMVGAKGLFRPSHKKPDQGQARVGADVDAGASFDPRTNAVRIDVSLPGGAQWSEVLPASCGSQPCLHANAKGSAFNARYPGGRSLRIARMRSGLWRLRYAARSTAMPALADGPVTLTIKLAGASRSTSLEGEWNSGRYLAR